VDRHGYPVPNPGPEFVLYPGDTLLVLATEDASNRARAFLNQPREHDAKTDLLAEIEIEGVGVPPGSPAAEKMLVELEIPASTGVQLVGIERGGNRLLNPGPFQGVEAGDQLLALGTPEQIKTFRHWLRGDSPDGSAAP
jgi:CPA2 family monovalent cation:H+ antiporter-2